jgi:hypothetical protein
VTGPPERIGWARRVSSHPVVRAWLLLNLVMSVPWAKAALDPPPGAAFVGTFHWVDDVYQYVSFAQQAEDGHFVFRNKLNSDPHRPAMVNLEWWATGVLSRVLGRRPLLAFRIVGILASLALLAGVDRWLVRAGLPATHRLPALILVGIAGGAGGWVFQLTSLPVWRSADLVTGVYPFLALLANPHWVVSTALLLWGLWAQTTGRGTRGLLVAGALGTALALTRPYDLAILFAVRIVVIHLFEPRREWPGAWARLALLLPGLAYAGWLFLRAPGFGTFTNAVFSRFVYPPIDLVAAMAPPMVAAAIFWRRGCWGPLVRGFQVWIPIVAVIFWVRPLSLPNQFAVAWGVPALVLLALALGRWRPVVTLAVAVALSASFLVALHIAWRGDPNWLVPRERLWAAYALREPCREGGVFLGPPDIGLYTIGLTGCVAWVAHQSGPDHRARVAAVRHFYSDATPPQRTALADGACATHLALPAGASPVSWMGEASGFRTVAVVGTGPSAIQLAVRPRPPHCAAY